MTVLARPAVVNDGPIISSERTPQVFSWKNILVVSLQGLVAKTN
jgi:hypothetical protein